MENANLSVVIPIYKNEPHLSVLNTKLNVVLAELDPNYEIIYVCDGSPDNSWFLIEQIALNNSKVVGINLSQNYGQQQAIMCGIDVSTGNWVVVMDGDLQDNPEEIKILYQKAHTDNVDMVVRRRINRKDQLLTKVTSALYYKIYNLLIDGIKYDGATGNFGIYSRRVINAIIKYKENDPSFAYFAKIVGFSKSYVDIEQDFRELGESSYTFKKRLKLALNYFISHSTKPMRLMVIFGLTMALCAFASGLWIAFRYYFHGTSVEGWTSIAIILLFQTGWLSILIGLVGLYIGKIFIQSKCRPQYLIQESINEKKLYI